METDPTNQQNKLLPNEVVEENLYFADASTVGATRDSGPRPDNIRLPLVSSEEHDAEFPYSH